MHITGVIEKREQKMQQRLVLAAGRWHRLFSQVELHNMVSQALNGCVYHDLEPPHSFRMDIHGYLLHRQLVYLVLHIHKRQLHRMLQYFSVQMQALLVAGLRQRLRYGGSDELRRALHRLEQPHLKLFRTLPFTDGWLAQLITGHKVVLPFYDPHLAWLQRLVHNNPFCSTLDYRGGQGPVIIKKPAP